MRRWTLLLLTWLCVTPFEAPVTRASANPTAAEQSVFASARRAGCDLTVRLADLPSYVPQAFVAIEDRRFFRHFGVDLIGVARAAAHDLSRGAYVEGASTITQQLVRTLYLSRERSWSRKLHEARLAVWLENTLSKRQILRLYLSCIYLGPGLHGVDQASRAFFGHGAAAATVNEAALLAGAASSPARFSPLRHPAAARRRAAQVRAAMQRESAPGR